MNEKVAKMKDLVPSSEREQARLRSYRGNSAVRRAPDGVLGMPRLADDPGAFITRVDMSQFNDERVRKMRLATLRMLCTR